MPLLAPPPWHWPVPDHTVVRAFRLDADRYAAGQHRGITLSAAPGTAVRAACAGRVTFAGRVPGAGPTVSVACGRLSATYTRLGKVTVRRGVVAVPGGAVGAVGAAGAFQLGARVRARRDGYVDPLTLLRADPAPPPGLAPPPRARRIPRLPPAVPRPEPARAPARAPWLPLGLGLAGAAGLFGAGRRVRAWLGWGRRGRVGASGRDALGPASVDESRPGG